MSIIIPIKKGSKHYEKTGICEFTYRYGYQPIAGDSENVSACVEKSKTRYPEAVIRQKVTDYCASVGIPNEYRPQDYGFEAGAGEQAEA